MVFGLPVLLLSYYVMITRRPCTIAGCKHDSRAFSPYCPAHRRTLARNGHPEQTAIRAPELRPFLALLLRRQADNADSAAWAILRQRWSAIIDWSTGIVNTVQAGRIYARSDAAVARHFLAVAGAADADTVSRVAMAVAMLARSNPRRFLNDQAVHVQMARHVIKLAPGSMGRYWDHKKKTMRSARVEVPARVLRLMGEQLNVAFGGAAAQLHHIEVNRVPPAERERKALAAAFEALKV